MSDQNSTKVKEWVDLALKQHDLFNYDIEIEGRTKKGDGYMSDIYFIKVSGQTKSGAKKTVHLAIKSSKDSEKLKEKAPLRQAFCKEIFIYNKVRPTFQKFQEEKGLQEPIDVMPYCYATRVTDNSELLILENLRTEGFQLWDKTLPVTSKHIQLVLEAYGRWHALSVALKAQKPDVFQDMVGGIVNTFSAIHVQMKYDVTMGREFQIAKKTVINDSESDILKHLQYSQDDITYAFTDMFSELPDERVLLHGDCWSSNFLFKSLDDETNPSAVRVIDWQCSGLGSPAFDLSHFIYSCVDTEQYPDVKELLKIYYNTFSKYLVSFGCDPEKLFSFKKLTEHWKRFSRFGLFWSCLVIRICSMDDSEVPDFGETADQGQDLMEKLTFGVSEDEVYLRRVRNNFLHYCRNVE